MKVAGVKAETVIEVLRKIPSNKRRKVKEITLDMTGNMELISRRAFTLAVRVTDRFHVQQLATEALQEMRIKHRWAALDAENEAIEKAKKGSYQFQSNFLDNGDTLKQLLARSRYVLYKRTEHWTPSKKERADLLFQHYPDLKQAYDLSMALSNIFEKTTDKVYGLARLAKWHEKTRQA